MHKILYVYKLQWHIKALLPHISYDKLHVWFVNKARVSNTLQCIFVIEKMLWKRYAYLNWLGTHL